MAQQGTFKLRFSIDGDVPYSRAFTLYAHEAADLSDPLSDIADDLIKQIGQQFLSEGAYGLGERWHPLSPAYAAWKEQHFPGRPLLVRTGAMRALMLDRERTVRVFKDRLLYLVEGIDAEGHDIGARAWWHQTGAGHNPTRKIVAIPSAGRRGWDRILHEWIIGLRRGPLRRSPGAAG